MYLVWIYHEKLSSTYKIGINTIGEIQYFSHLDMNPGDSESIAVLLSVT